MTARIGSMALVLLLTGGLLAQAAPPAHRHRTSVPEAHSDRHASSPWQDLQHFLFGSPSRGERSSWVPPAGHKMRSSRYRHSPRYGRYPGSSDASRQYGSSYRRGGHRYHPGQTGSQAAASHSHKHGDVHRHGEAHRHGDTRRAQGEPTPVEPAGEQPRRYGRIFSSEQPRAGARASRPWTVTKSHPGRRRSRRVEVPERVIQDEHPGSGESVKPAALESPRKAAPLAKPEPMVEKTPEGSRGRRSSRRRRSQPEEAPAEPIAPATTETPLEPLPATAGPQEKDIPALVPQQPEAPQPSVSAESKPAPLQVPAAADQTGPAPLLVALSPTLAVQTLGPKELVVGQEAEYRIRVKNAGQVNAQGIIVTLAIPAWVEVVHTRASQGKAHIQGSGGNRTLQWHLEQLAPGNQTELALKLRPTQNRPVALQVRWITQPLDSRLQIAVKEARLELSLTGPDQVEFGRRAIYRLTFSNPGTADAKNVKIRLLPIDPTDQADEHTLGTIPAGGRKVVEVELVARRRGTLNIQVEATAEGGITATSAKQVQVLRAQLAVAVQGPKFRYAGTQADYRVEVSNRGDGPAREVVIEAQLPSTARYLDSSHSGHYDEKQRVIRWKVGRLGPGESLALKAQLEWTAEGQNTLRVKAKGKPQLEAAARLQTQVVGLADLDLDLKGPRGAVPVGKEITYQVILSNQGTKAAESIYLRVQLSPQLQPLQVEGVGEKFQMQGSQIGASIDLVAAGKKQVVKIRCRALQPGSHVVRVEAVCPSLSIQLGEQKTTRFFGDELPSATTSQPSQPGGSSQPEANHLEPAPLEPIPEPKAPAGATLPGLPQPKGASALPGKAQPEASATPGQGILPTLQRRYGEPTPVVPLPKQKDQKSEDSGSSVLESTAKKQQPST